MKKISRLFLFGGLILALLTTACAVEEGAVPTFPGTLLPAVETSTPLVTETAGTAETETATEILETPPISATEAVSTQATTDGTASTTETPGTPGIPVTGVDVVLIECQFCVDTMAHALLVLPDTATFEITSPPPSTTISSTSVTATSPTCSSVEVNNGKQVVLCSGPEMTPLTLNICIDSATCTDFPVDLLDCPLVQSGTAVPSNTEELSGAGTGPTATAVIISTPTP